MERPTDLFSVGLLFQYLNELPPKNSRRMEVGGISRVGTAWTYEKNFNKRFALECSGISPVLLPAMEQLVVSRLPTHTREPS